MVEVLAVAVFFAMELITILNRCHRFPGFVYQHARFSPDKKSIEVAVQPRRGSRAVCSGCHQAAPGYDHLPERRFEFMELEAKRRGMVLQELSAAQWEELWGAAKSLNHKS